MKTWENNHSTLKTGEWYKLSFVNQWRRYKCFGMGDDYPFIDRPRHPAISDVPYEVYLPGASEHGFALLMGYFKTLNEAVRFVNNQPNA